MRDLCFFKMQPMKGLAFYLWMISTTSAQNATMNIASGLSNKHLVIAAKHWKPFMIVDKDSQGNVAYSGVMYELLTFMQQARNLTLTIISEGTEWGTCDENDSCTGMFEMVNKSEVDIALGILLVYYYVSYSEVRWSFEFRLSYFAIKICVRHTFSLLSVDRFG